MREVLEVKVCESERETEQEQVGVRRGYENVLNAIMEDGEATVQGLRRSKLLFFRGGSLSYSKQAHKRPPVSPATSPSDSQPFISLPAYQ